LFIVFYQPTLNNIFTFVTCVELWKTNVDKYVCEVTSESFKIDIAQVLFKKYNL